MEKYKALVSKKDVINMIVGEDVIVKCSFII